MTNFEKWRNAYSTVEKAAAIFRNQNTCAGCPVGGKCGLFLVDVNSDSCDEIFTKWSNQFEDGARTNFEDWRDGFSTVEKAAQTVSNWGSCAGCPADGKCGLSWVNMRPATCREAFIKWADLPAEDD